jgi:hypothetical protein
MSKFKRTLPRARRRKIEYKWTESGLNKVIKEKQHRMLFKPMVACTRPLNVFTRAF